MKSTKTILLTGGGTAGHVMPNINLKDELKKHFDKIYYVGTENGIEKTLITTQTDYIYKSINPAKLSRGKILKNLAIPFKFTKSISDSKKLLKEIKPSVVFSKGGFVGLPVVIAAKKLKIPCVCHESDISMGLANKIAKRYADKICTNFKVTAEQNGKKCVFTGMPLKLSKLSKEDAKQKLNINTTLPVLLICGGSLGAVAINNFVFENINHIADKYFVLHLVGKNNLNEKIKHKNYMQIEFSNDMFTIFKATDYALSRAGANTIIELLANMISTIFIPLPKTVSRGDQIDNAKYLESKGLSKTLLQENLTIENLLKMLNLLKKEQKNIISAINNEQITDGTNNIINQILSSAK